MGSGLKLGGLRSLSSTSETLYCFFLLSVRIVTAKEFKWDICENLIDTPAHLHVSGLDGGKDDVSIVSPLVSQWRNLSVLLSLGCMTTHNRWGSLNNKG